MASYPTLKDARKKLVCRCCGKTIEGKRHLPLLAFVGCFNELPRKVDRVLPFHAEHDDWARRVLLTEKRYQRGYRVKRDTSRQGRLFSLVGLVRASHDHSAFSPTFVSKVLLPRVQGNQLHA
ncbi:hypothetical protein FQZ97_903060 [compost metagenome]